MTWYVSGAFLKPRFQDPLEKPTFWRKLYFVYRHITILYTKVKNTLNFMYHYKISTNTKVQYKSIRVIVQYRHIKTCNIFKNLYI